MMKKAFLLWLDIAIFLFLVIFAGFIVFSDIMTYTNFWFYMKEIFISIFIITIFFSIWAIGYFFNLHGFKVQGIKQYLKIYWSILWRALIIVTPIIGLIAVIFKGSIFSRILTIFIEILAGFPAIYWYLKKLEKNS
ncbi:hypothetical protein [Caminibacter pacificus]